MRDFAQWFKKNLFRITLADFLFSSAGGHLGAWEIARPPSAFVLFFSAWNRW
jgi:hypothetical protein